MLPIEIRNNFVLLDANLLINSSKYPDAFSGFYESLNKALVKAVLDHTVKFEFLRGFRKKGQREVGENFLDLLFGANRLELIVDNKIVEDATELAIMYGRKNIQVNDGDYFIASQMKKYSDKLYLATSNHTDFPRFIFDRIYLHSLVIDKTDQIINVGIYRFNRDKYKNLLDIYTKESPSL